MSVADALRAVAAGRRSPALLHTCRLAAFGTEAYGEEAVLATLRAAGPASDDAEALIGRGHALLSWDGAALFADLHAGRIARLWLVGPYEAAPPAPAMPVAFDPDLAQARGDVFARDADHPELDPALLPDLAQAGRDLVDALPGLRNRAFLLRAFTAGEESAALFALYRLDAHRLGFEHAVVRLRAGAVATVHDAPALSSILA